MFSTTHDSGTLFWRKVNCFCCQEAIKKCSACVSSSCARFTITSVTVSVCVTGMIWVTSLPFSSHVPTWNKLCPCGHCSCFCQRLVKSRYAINPTTVALPLNVLRFVICCSFLQTVSVTASYLSFTFTLDPHLATTCDKALIFKSTFAQLSHKQPNHGCFLVDSTFFGLFLTNVENDAFTSG